jgi:hypothetical protein
MAELLALMSRLFDILLPLSTGFQLPLPLLGGLELRFAVHSLA